MEPEPAPSIASSLPVQGDELQRQEDEYPSHPHTNPRRLDTSRLAPFDKDIRDDCRSLQLHCTSDVFAHVYLQCPATCTKLLEEEGMKGTTLPDQVDYLVDGVEALRTRHGKRINTDRFDGQVLVLGLVPLLPGMAVYYYELMDHLHSIFSKKGCEFVIIPIDHGLGIHIQERHMDGKKINNNQQQPGVVVLEEEPTSIVERHPWVKHLISIKPRSGAAVRDSIDDDDIDRDANTKSNDGQEAVQIHQLPLHTDRVTFYIVSADGYFVERVISPSLATLTQKVSTYLKTVDYEL